MNTTTALVPIQDMERMAVAIAKSNLFGMKTPDQVLALMLIAQAEGRHPAIVARDYDIIQNRPAKKAEAMLRDFLDAGGKVEWHQLDDNCADATFSHPQGGNARISWDLARAKKAGIAGKDNYAKYPRQMLRSRTVSEGCRTVYPAATSGLYEPGEVRAIAREDKHETKDMGKAEVITNDASEGDLSECLPLPTDQPAPPHPATTSGAAESPAIPLAASQQAAGADPKSTARQAQMPDTHQTGRSEPKGGQVPAGNERPSPLEAKDQPASPVDHITQEQGAELSDLILEAGIPQQKILGKAGVQSLAALTGDDYADLKAMLERRIKAKA